MLLTRLRRHPIPIAAHFGNCLTLTYAITPAVLESLLPPGLTLETIGGLGFVAIAVVEAKSLRPAGWPRAVGQDFFLAGYRIFTTFHAPNGPTLRGLRILRSDANRRRMVVGGNLLTHYNYHRCDATVCRMANRMDIAVTSVDGFGDLDLTADLSTETLPAGSPFPSIRAARRFAGPLPYTFDYERETHSIVAINATRTNWRPAPVAVEVRQASFFDQPVFAGHTPTLAAAFHVANVDYRWNRGIPYKLPEAA